MRVVVVGATGNVGSRVVAALRAHPAVDEVVGIARRLPARQDDGVQHVAADVAHDDLLAHFQGADAVVHLAWLFQPSHRPDVTWEVNVGGSTRVFETAAQALVGTLVHASSVGAYTPAPGRTVDETWPTDGGPKAAYGREKAYVERVLDRIEARHREMRVVRLRPAFTFQRASATEQRRLFLGPLVPRAVLRPGRLPFVPLPAGVRFQALHTDDVAAAYVAAVVTEGARGAYNIAADPIIDGALLAEVLGARPLVLPRSLVRAVVAVAWHLRLAPTDPTLLDLFLTLPTLDWSRARRELGWEPKVSGVEALRELFEAMADGAAGTTPPLAEEPAEQL